MDKKKIILCPNPYRDRDMRVAARSKAILDECGFSTIVCLPFQKEGYGADLGFPIGQLAQEIKQADLLIAFGFARDTRPRGGLRRGRRPDGRWRVPVPEVPQSF